MIRPPLRLLIFISLFFLAPLPFFMVEVGRVPAARMFQLAGYLVMLAASEGGQGAVIAAAWLLGTQATLYAVAIFFAADSIGAGLERLNPRAALGVTTFLVMGAILASLLMRPYVTPFSLVSPVSSLAEVFR